MVQSLQGVRIWLSGSVPDDATEEESKRILAFVSSFAKQVFRWNGRLVHGSHPTIRKTLLTAAREHRDATQDKAGLVLAVSLAYSKEPEQYDIDLAQWNAVCAEKVIETREALPDPGEQTVSPRKSLSILRQALVEQCNVIVAIGGKWWKVAAANAGVPEEIEIARANHLPLFLMGGLGGATQEYLRAHPELLRSCTNGLTEAQNLELSEIKNPDDLANRVLEQIARLPLRVRSQQSGRPFRILCLDGGGIPGAFTAAVLKYLEDATGYRVFDHFDLIAGTSTGGILAIGLGLKMTASDMLDFYINEGPVIFPVEAGFRRLAHSFRHWFGAKFDQSVLKKKLETAYATAPIKSSVLDNSCTRLVVPAYNTESDSLLVFRTPHGSGGANDKGRNLVEVALATAAAPTYFRPIQMGAILAVDGGVWANCPTTVALAEAIKELQVAPERIEMLSVGTTFAPKLEGQPLLVDGTLVETVAKPFFGRIKAKILSWFWKPDRIQDKLGWLPNIAGFLMKTQAQTADYVSRGILGSRCLRVDKPTTDASLDDPAAINRLIGLANDAAAEHLPEIRIRFLNGVPVDPWN